MKTSILKTLTTPFKTACLCDTAGSHFFVGFVSGYVTARKHLLRGTWDDSTAFELAEQVAKDYAAKLGESYVHAPAKHFADAFVIAYTEALDDKDMQRIHKGQALRTHARGIANWYQIHISAGGAA